MSRDGGGMGNVRRLALRTERLAELSSDEMRAVHGGVWTLDEPCIYVSDLSHLAFSLCDGCLTARNCRTLFC